MAVYTYLVGSLILLLVWGVLYYLRKDLRREMVVMGGIFAVLGVITDLFFFTKDWWRPDTITGTVVGIESAIFGFAVAGSMAVIYEEIFKKRVVLRRRTDHHHTKQAIFLGSLFFGIWILLFYGFGYSSFYSSLIATIVAVIIIYFLRPDLIPDSLATATIITLIAIPAYLLLFLVEPGYVQSWYLLDHISGILFLGIPIEDIVWFFATGLLLGCVYEFWQGGRLQRIKK